MDKEREVEGMAKALYAPHLEEQNEGYGELCNGCRKCCEDEPCKEKWNCHFYRSIAEYLHGAGYGSVRQAAIEAVERVRDRVLSLRSSDVADTQQEYYLAALNDVIYNIDCFIEETRSEEQRNG